MRLLCSPNKHSYDYFFCCCIYVLERHDLHSIWSGTGLCSIVSGVVRACFQSGLVLVFNNILSLVLVCVQ